MTSKTPQPQCTTPGCTRLQSGVARDKCQTCYGAYVRAVRQKKTTWEELEKRGMIAPAKARYRNREDGATSERGTKVMKADLGGMAANIKAGLMRHARLGREASMVDEMVRYIKELEAIVEPLNELLGDGERAAHIYGRPGFALCEIEAVYGARFIGDNLAEALKAAVETKRRLEAEAKEGN